MCDLSAESVGDKYTIAYLQEAPAIEGNPGAPVTHMAGGEGIGIESARQCKLHRIPYKGILYHSTIIIIFK